MPRPCLPVDSAISCSAHRPKELIGSSITNVSFSRAALARPPRARPRPPPPVPPRRPPEPQARVALEQLAVLDRDLAGLEHRADVDAGERRRHEAEVGQRAVTA